MRERTFFILNDTAVVADTAPGMLLLDYIRYHARLTGTKIGCREGDCGACTVLVGEPEGDHVVYTNVTSCLMPLANAGGKHIVTVEAFHTESTHPIQAAFVEEGATQCGFCTPGFIVSLVGHCLDSDPGGRVGRDPIAAISGNICRCTGYKSIERAVLAVERRLAGVDTVDGLIAAGVLPRWFAGIPARLRELGAPDRNGSSAVLVGGGTDLFVQRPDELYDESMGFVMGRPELRGVRLDGDTCVVGAAVTMEQLARSDLMVSLFPQLPRHMKLVASQPIRNMATLAGNFANASPIGDMTIFFLALDSSLTLRLGDRRRTVAMRSFYRGYKDTGLARFEEIENVFFKVPPPGSFFNFEKVSKRTHLDIASVNTAISFSVDEGVFTAAHCAVGGVAPIPLYLDKTSAFLIGKPVSAATVRAVAQIGDSEIAPISDVRGSDGYKRLLFRQLFYAHFMEHCAETVEWGALV